MTQSPKTQLSKTWFKKFEPSLWCTFIICFIICLRIYFLLQFFS